MEAALNVCWLVIALAILGQGARHAFALHLGGELRSDSLRVLIVSACLVVILFPIISVTDDLLAATFFADPFSSASDLFRDSDSVQAPGNPVLSTAAIQNVLPSGLALACSWFWSLHSEVRRHLPSFFYTRPSEGRAPPSFCSQPA